MKAINIFFTDFFQFKRRSDIGVGNIKTFIRMVWDFC